MIATVIAKRVPGLRICGLDIPEWGIVDDPESAGLFKQEFAKTAHVSGHKLDIGRVVDALERGDVDCVDHEGWACRVEYYGGPEQFRDLFPTPSHLEGIGVSENKLLVNVRAAEIASGAHPDYIPTPTALIDHVIENTGLTPVFMGQLGDDWYTHTLRKRFSDCEFIPSRNPIHDFETIRQTKHVLVPVSTFSWLACWLSERCTDIHMPLLGMFNPMQRPDVNLAPRHDKRYTFYGFPTVYWQGEKGKLDSLSFAKAAAGSILFRQYVGQLIAGTPGLRRILMR